MRYEKLLQTVHAAASAVEAAADAGVAVPGLQLIAWTVKEIVSMALVSISPFS